MKHKLFSRFISVLLAVVMLASLMSMPSLADTVTGADSTAIASTEDNGDTSAASSDPAALPEEGTEGESEEPADSTANAENTGDTQEPEDATSDAQEPTNTTEGTDDEEAAGDTQNEGAEQKAAESTESTEATQPDSEQKDSDSEAASSESFDCEAFYEKLMNVQTMEEMESLINGLSDEDAASFQQWLDDDKAAAIDEKAAQLSGDSEEEPQPAPAVNYDKVAPISAATAAAGALTASANTFSLATPNALPNSTGDDTDNLVLEKSAEPVEGEEGTYQITLDAYTTGTVTAGTAPAYDIVLVLDMSTSMEESFSSLVYEGQLDKSDTYYVDGYTKVEWCGNCGSWTNGCRSIYGYHHEGTKYTPKTSADDNSSGHVQFYKYTTRLEALKQAATTFVSNVADQKGNNRIAVVGFHNDGVVLAGLQDASKNEQTLLNAINEINNWNLQGATEHGKGLQKAEAILADADGTNRERLVVMITDGEPAPARSNNWSARIVKEAINSANSLKNTYRAAVYTISVMPGTDASGNTAMDKYMRYMSSNYPKAEYTENTDVGSDPDTIVSQITPGRQADLEDGESFYLTAGDVETLESIFDQIGDQIETPNISLDEKTIIQDAVTEYFEMPAGTNAVTVQKIPYNGSNFVEDNAQPVEGINIDISDNKVQVSGFNFDHNFVTDTKKEDNTYGYKLRITFNVTAKEEFWGGNQVPTNVAEDSGVYAVKDGKTKLVENFDEHPTVDVPLKEISLQDKVLNVYCGNAAPDESQMVDVEGWPTDENAWQVAYVKIAYQMNGGAFDTQQDGTYNVTATLSPKYTGDITETKSDTAKATVNVFKPTVTWHDTTQNAGSAVKPIDNNLVETVWKHGNVLSQNVEMFGALPTLTYTFQQADDSEVPDTLQGSIQVKVATVINNGCNITKNTKFVWQKNADSTGCLECADPNPEYQFRIHDTSSEYPVRFYLEGVSTNEGATNYEFEDKWAVLNSVYTGGFVALPEANTCVYSEDLVIKNGRHDANDVITGNTDVSAWLNDNKAQPIDLTVNDISTALRALVEDDRLSEKATLVSVGGTTYTVEDVLKNPGDFELVYTQVSENEDYIQKYKRGNRLNEQWQKSYHVHLTVKYKPGDMTITKTFSGVDELPDEYALNVKLEGTTVKTLTLDDAEYNLNSKTYTWTLEDLNGGTYEVEEAGYTVEDMDLKATFKVTAQSGQESVTKGTSADVLVEMNQTTNVAIANEYTESKGSLEIQKSVTLNSGMGKVPDSLKDTVFLFKVEGENNFSTIVSIKCNGEAAYQGSVTLDNLPAGTYTVTELPSLGFECVGSSAVRPVTVVGGETEKTLFTNNCDGDEWGDKENLPNTFTYDVDEDVWKYQQGTGNN